MEVVYGPIPRFCAKEQSYQLAPDSGGAQGPREVRRVWAPGLVPAAGHDGSTYRDSPGSGG